MTQEGEPTTLPVGVDLSAYRIVQEALTNTLRHGNATRAAVAVRYGPDAVDIDVVDDGRGTTGRPPDRDGRGLIGMRQRAAVLGGTVETGPTGRGGFRSAPASRWMGRQRRPETAGMNIRVVVADDQTLVRAGFRLILDSRDDLEVVGEAADGATAVDLVAELCPRSC